MSRHHRGKRKNNITKIKMKISLRKNVDKLNLKNKIERRDCMYIYFIVITMLAAGKMPDVVCS